MLPPVLERLPIEAVTLLLRARRHLPEPRAEPAAAREPRVHRREDARGGRRPRGRLRRRRRPLLLRRRHGRVRPRRLRDRAARRVDPRRRSRGGKVIYDVRASWAVPETIERPAARRSSTASATRSSSTACARRTRSSAARCRRTTTSATSRRPTRASCRSCSCSSWSRREGQKLSEILAPFRERYFLTGEINTPVADVRAEAAGAEGALRRRPRLAPRRHLGRLRRLALQRAAVEHRAAAAAQPRGALGGADGARSATRCSR